MPSRNVHDPSLRDDGFEVRSHLRFLACGSVDDGKSTLMGRLIYESGSVSDDQLATLAAASRRYGTTGGDLDFALLLDGLEDERRQGLTIDVAYRYFATARRSFIAADVPGHEEYTCNMATGASHSELAVILVDARKGITAQTRRHATICSLLGIRHAALAVNKMDLVGFEPEVFDAIVSDFSGFASRLAFEAIVPIPLAARLGDGVASLSDAMPWYRGPSLLGHLETVDVAQAKHTRPFRFPVQLVSRPNSDFRGYAGTVSSGRINRGDPVVVAATGRASRIARIVTADGDRQLAQAGDAITLVLEDDIDIGRGDMLAAPQQRPAVLTRFSAQVVWMAEEPLAADRPCLLRLPGGYVPATVTAVVRKLGMDKAGTAPDGRLALNEIGHVHVTLNTPLAIDPYGENLDTGGFVLVDRFSNKVLGAGMVEAGLRGATNIHPQSVAIDKAARTRLKNNKPAIVWFTGLPGSGKSTLADLVDRRLNALGCHSYVLDGDNLRHGLNGDLGFSEADRSENIRRAGEVARLFVDAGIIVLCAFISPFQREREAVRGLVAEGEFIEVFVDTPLDVCVARDPKGLYAKAREGLIRNVTGLDSPYEAPTAPELRLATVERAPEEVADSVLALLERRGIIAT
jgi:bifunctional enzyme CysN/CysC